MGQAHAHLRSGAAPIDFLTELPEELALRVLSWVPEESMPAVRCVSKRWRNLALDNAIWRERCRRNWGHLRRLNPALGWKQTYTIMIFGCGIARKDPVAGVDYLIRHDVVDSSTDGVARFLALAKPLCKRSVGLYLGTRPEVMRSVVFSLELTGLMLPDGMRMLFGVVQPHTSGTAVLAPLLRLFIERYVTCNPAMQPQRDSLYILCYSLLLLSADLTSAHVRNKMTKREFLRNNRLTNMGDEYLGQLYDNVYLFGHVAEPRRKLNYTNALARLTR